MVGRVLDTSRQWPTCYGDTSKHHVARYMFAAKRASGRVLDASCGAGYGSALIFRGCPAVVGVDIDEQAIAWARAFFPGPTYLCGDIEKEPWAGKFDTIVSLETIEHLKDPSKSLRAFRRCCYGEFIVSSPNEETYKFKAEDFAEDASPHFRHYTPKEFEDLLKLHHFEVVDRYSQMSKQDPKVIDGTDGRFLVYVCR